MSDFLWTLFCANVNVTFNVFTAVTIPPVDKAFLCRTTPQPRSQWRFWPRDLPRLAYSVPLKTAIFVIFSSCNTILHILHLTKLYCIYKPPYCSKNIWNSPKVYAIIVFNKWCLIKIFSLISMGSLTIIVKHYFIIIKYCSLTFLNTSY